MSSKIQLEAAQPDSTPRVAARRGGPFWSYGFRPFFVLAACAAIGTLIVLVAGFAGASGVSDALPLARWHGHEMVFGFVGAAIAGFLLTAVPSWTGTKAVSGAPLGALAALWLLARAALSPWLGLQATPWTLLSPLFFLALGVVLSVPLLRSRNYRNFQFLLLLALLGAADLLFVAVQLGWVAAPPFDPLRFAANVVLLLIAVVGGRIVPLFTRNALVQRGEQSSIVLIPWLERASLAVLVAVILVDVIRPETVFAGAVAAVAAVLLGSRVSRWQGYCTLQMPIVVILHAGYAWLPIALALKSAWLLLHAPWAANWLHALTAGAFGTMILGVMTRVALGHTGRQLVVARPISVAYVLVILGAALRVAGPTLVPSLFVPLLLAAALLWGGAFLIFLVVYWPILSAPRADDAAAR
jgi:uncharacterized protein involved in response to NO